LKGREHRAVDFKVVLLILNCDLAAIFALRHPRAPRASGRVRPPRLAHAPEKMTMHVPIFEHVPMRFPAAIMGQLGHGAAPAAAGARGPELFDNQRIRLAAAGDCHLAVVAEDGAVYICGGLSRASATRSRGGG